MTCRRRFQHTYIYIYTSIQKSLFVAPGAQGFLGALVLCRSLSSLESTAQASVFDTWLDKARLEVTSKTRLDVTSRSEVEKNRETRLEVLSRTRKLKKTWLEVTPRLRTRKKTRLDVTSRSLGSRKLGSKSLRGHLA